MRILQTTDAVGGVFTFALDLSAALREAGHEIFLVNLGPAMSQAQLEQARGAATAVFQGDFPLEWMAEAEGHLDACGEWLLKRSRALGAELIHLNQVAFGHLDWGVPVVSVGHSCVLSWWQAVKGEPAPDSWSCYAHRVGRGLRGSDAVVAPTRAMLQSLRQYYGPLQHCRTIPNGRPPSPPGTAEKEPFVLFAGRLWDEAKNVQVLSRAAASGELDWPVMVAGDAASPGGASVGLTGLQHVGLLPTDELAELYSRAGVYCLPAFYEPFGLSALEAASHGCPLVLSDIATLREIWGDNAMYVPPRDPQWLVTALNLLARDPGLRTSYGERAKRRAGQLDLASMAASYGDLYREVLQRPHQTKEEAFR